MTFSIKSYFFEGMMKLAFFLGKGKVVGRKDKTNLNNLENAL
jgi:hypothetical protein